MKTITYQEDEVKSTSVIQLFPHSTREVSIGFVTNRVEYKFVITQEQLSVLRQQLVNIKQAP